LILVDAFSQVYFSNKYTPFLCSLAENGISSALDPLFVFRGIETTIFTGLWPSVHNVWTEFKLAESTKNGKKDRLLQQIIKALEVLPTDDLRTKSRYFIERYLFKEFYRTLNLIPSTAMPYFETSQSKETVEKGSLGNLTTLFDAFRGIGVQYVLIEPWIGGDKGVLKEAKKMIEFHSRYNFWYLKFNDLDHLGHKFGPEPATFKNQLTKIDAYIEQVVNLLQKKRHALKVLVLADHGMSKVYKTVNIWKDLRKLRSQLYEDYLVFADSTMLRFWFSTEQAVHEIYDFLQQIGVGHILSTREKEFLKMPFDPKYGEMIYVVDEGYLIHPSFFHSRSKPRGMHGYAYPKTPEAFPILIMNDEMVNTLPTNDKVKYIDIPHLILSALLPVTKHTPFGLPQN